MFQQVDSAYILNFHTNNGKAETCRLESCSRQIEVNTMAEKVVIWEPTEYKSVCTRCGTANLAKHHQHSTCVLSVTRNIWLQLLIRKKINIEGNEIYRE
jgi:hypothetical protein